MGKPILGNWANNYDSAQLQVQTSPPNFKRGTSIQWFLEICDPQSLDPICGKFDKFLAHGKGHIGQMGKWPWQCTTKGLDNSTKLRIEKIRQAVTKIWVPQVWQPPARAARPPAQTVTTIPLQPGGLRGKNGFQIGIGHWVVVTNHQMPLWKKIHSVRIDLLKNCSHAAA